MSNTMTVKRKRQHMDIGVSKTNFNRVRFGSKTLETVLKMEGHLIRNGILYVGDQEIHLSAIDIYTQERVVLKPVKAVEATVSSGKPS